jgi:Lipocalin-like domain
MTRERTGFEQRFVGAWRLISWKATSPSGEIRYPHGETPEGQIIYTANGQMSAQLMNPGAALPDVNGLSPGEVLARIATTFFAYHGTYEIDAPARTVTHHVVGSLAPNWVGTDQVRAYEFLSDDRLELTARIGDDSVAKAAATSGTQVLVWERIP